MAGCEPCGWARTCRIDVRRLRTAAGFDCCRVINILTSARAAGYIDERTSAALFERYVHGFVDRCSG